MINKNYYLRKAEELKQRLLPASSVLVVMHNYPDPDCIASAFGIQLLLSHWGVSTSQITFGGFVGRAENRAMIRFLNIQAIPIILIELSDFDRIIVVDAFPGDANLSLAPEIQIDAVIDHHPHKVARNSGFYSLIRKEIGSTSTLVTLFLIAEHCEIPPDVATALFYGIKTDTHYLSRNTTREDLDCYKYLFDLVDHHALSKIEFPDRDVEYFRILHRSTQSMTMYSDSVGYIHLGTVSAPDYIAEIADLFHSLETIEWMVCSALFKNKIFFSIRSKKELTAGKKAEKIARKLKGSGGGHSNIGAGLIPITEDSVDRTLSDFTNTFKTVLNIKDIPGQPLSGFNYKG